MSLSAGEQAAAVRRSSGWFRLRERALLGTLLARPPADELLAELGGLEPEGAGDGKLDAAWRAHRIHAAYTVVASCQIVTFPEGQSARRRIFAESFLGRAEAAVSDLEAVAAVREAAGL